MGTVYKEPFTKPLPAAAKIIVRKGQRLAESQKRSTIRADVFPVVLAFLPVQSLLAHTGISAPWWYLLLFYAGWCVFWAMICLLFGCCVLALLLSFGIYYVPLH